MARWAAQDEEAHALRQRFAALGDSSSPSKRAKPSAAELPSASPAEPAERALSERLAAALDEVAYLRSETHRLRAATSAGIADGGTSQARDAHGPRLAWSG